MRIRGLSASASAAWILGIVCALGVRQFRASAQCQPSWQPGVGFAGSVAGTDAQLHPSGKVIIATPYAGNIYTCGLAVLDPIDNSWSNVPCSPFGSVSEFTVLPNGNILAGGILLDQGQVAEYDWQTGQWQNLGGAGGTLCRAVAQLPNGDVLAAFYRASGYDWLTRLNRTTGTWTVIGSIFGTVYDIEPLADGRALIAGNFQGINGQDLGTAVRWDPTTNTFDALNAPLFLYTKALAAPNGDYLFTCRTGVKRFNPTTSTWTSLAASNPFGVHSVAVGPDGTLYAGALVNGAATAQISHVMRYDTPTDTWVAVPGLRGSTTEALVILPDGDIVATGTISIPSPTGWGGTVRYDAQSMTWGGSGLTTRGSVEGLLPLADGTIFAYGSFRMIEGVPAASVAIQNPDTREWRALAQNFDVPNTNSIRCAAQLPDGDIVIGGFFEQQIDGVACRNLARYDMSSGTWSAFTNVPDSVVDRIVVRPSGEVVMAGDFTSVGGLPARWLGQWNPTTDTWTSIPFVSLPPLQGATYFQALSLHSLNAHEILLSGFVYDSFFNRQQITHRYSFTTGAWTAAPVTGLRAPVATPLNANEIVIVGERNPFGNPTENDGVKVWNMQTGAVRSLQATLGASEYANAVLVRPNGDLIIAGTFTEIAGQPMQRLARYDSQTGQWSPGGELEWGNTVKSMINLDANEFWISGNFNRIGSVVALTLARFGCVRCDSIDFNANGVYPEDQDVIDFFAVLSGAACASCNDIDFNNNGVFPEDQDVVDFFNVLAGGTCP